MTVQVRAPYPGLRPFWRSETELFFGRDGCINSMVDRLAATRFLAVLGSSGTGKSSLVKAGLLDALELGLMARAGSRWRIVDFQPQDAPLKNLAQRLLETDEPQNAAAEADVQLERTFLARGPRSIIERCRAAHLANGENLLLLVDQFEELFRYQDYSGREEAEAFVALLIESAHSDGFPIYVTITMRSEFLGACSLIDGLPEQINAGLYLTPRMTREECRKAIVGPARLCDIALEDSLVNRLLNDLASFAPWDESEGRENTQDRLVRRADQLPLLQYTLNRMWLLARQQSNQGHVRLSLADYKGLSSMLNDHADEIFAELSKEKLPVEKVFRALVSGTSVADAVRRPTRFDGLVAICGGDERAVRKVVEAYAAPGCNFLMPEFDPLKPFTAATVIDISHESLIRQWKRLSEWLTAESRAAQQWRRLNDRFSVGEPLRGRELENLVDWRKETKPTRTWASRYGGDFSAAMSFLEESERAEKRRFWLRTGTVASAFAILLVGALVVFVQWQRAESNYATAKDVFRNMTFNIAEWKTRPDMQILQVTEYLEQVKKALDKLVQAKPNDVQLEEMGALMLDNLTDAYLTAGGYLHLSHETALETNNHFRRLVAHEPANVSWRRRLSANLGKIGDIRRRLGDNAGARASYEQALAIERELARQEPENEDHPRQMSIWLVNIGDLQLRADERAGARASYEQALNIRHKLAADYPLLPIYLEDVSSTLDKIAELDLNSGDAQRALQLYREKQVVDQELRQRYRELKQLLSLSSDLEKIAGLQLRLGDEEGARRSDEERLAMDHKISIECIQLGDEQLGRDDQDEAETYYKYALQFGKRALDIAERNYSKEPNESTKKAFVNAAGAVSLAALLSHQPLVAKQSAETAFNVDSSQIATDVNRAHAYLLLGRYDNAKAIYLARKDTPKSADGSQTYASDISDRFDTFRKLGIAPPDLDRIAKEIGL